MNGIWIWVLQKSLLAFSKSSFLKKTSFVDDIKCCKRSFVSDKAYISVLRQSCRFVSFCNKWCPRQSLFSAEICTYCMVRVLSLECLIQFLCALSKVRSKVRFPNSLLGVSHMTSLCSCWLKWDSTLSGILQRAEITLKLSVKTLRLTTFDLCWAGLNRHKNFSFYVSLTIELVCWSNFALGPLSY